MNSITLKEKEGFIPLSSILHNAPWNINTTFLKHGDNEIDRKYREVRDQVLTYSAKYSLGIFTKWFLSKYFRSTYKDLINEVTIVLNKYNNNEDKFYEDINNIIDFKTDLPFLLNESPKYRYRGGSVDFKHVYEWIRSDSVKLNCNMHNFSRVGTTYSKLVEIFQPSIHYNFPQSVRIGQNKYISSGGNVFLYDREVSNIPYTNSNFVVRNVDYVFSIYVNKDVVKLVKLLLILGKQIPEEFFRVYINPFAPESFLRYFKKNKEDFVGNLPVYPCPDLVYRYKEPDISSIFAIERDYQGLANHIKNTISQCLILDNNPF